MDEKRTDDVIDVETTAEVMQELTGPVSQKRATRFYDRVRANISRYLTRKGTQVKGSEFLFLVPDVFILLWRLVNDKRVTGKNKVLVGTGIAYYLFPLDVIPEALVGPLGYLDDLVFAVYILNRMLNDTDEAIIREHWSGGEDVLSVIQRVLSSADGLVTRDFLEWVKKIVK